MDILIACNDQSIATRIRGALSKLGIECSHSQVLSHESARIVAANSRESTILVFYGSQQLATDDLSVLGELCATGGDRFKVVAVGPAFNAAAILQAVRSGAVDCLSLNGNLESEIRLVLDRLDTTQGERGRLGRLWTVISSVGGAGASIVAINLAAVVAQRQHQCGLLDLHWRGGDLASLLNASPRHTLLSLAGKAEQLDRTMLEVSLTKHNCGVHFLASPEPFSDYRQIRPELIQKIVQLTRAIYSTTVVDLEDCEHLDQVRTLAVSDRIVAVIRPDFVSVVRTKKLLNYLVAANVPREHITLVMNRTGQPKELTVSQAEEAIGMRVEHRIPDDPAAVNEAINLGVPLVIACPKARAALGIVHLAESLLGISSPRPHAGWTTSTWVGAQLLPLRSVTSLFGSVMT